jgi:hypothetical protein
VRWGKPPGELKGTTPPNVGFRGGSVAGNRWRFRTKAEVEFVSGQAGTISVVASRIGMECTKARDISGQRRGLPQPRLRICNRLTCDSASSTADTLKSFP